MSVISGLQVPLEGGGKHVRTWANSGGIPVEVRRLGNRLARALHDPQGPARKFIILSRHWNVEPANVWRER